jgi:hypothetical protein
MTLLPCTTPGQEDCIQCSGSTGGICTPTEAVLVQLDISSGKATAPGPDPAGSCYQCLLGFGCIDSPSHHFTGLECGDFTGRFKAGNGFMGQKQDICVDTLKCVLGPQGKGCENDVNGVVHCYCGTDGTSHSVTGLYCAAHGSSVNGPCLVPETNGSRFPPTNSSDITLGFTDTSGANPSGIANALVACASSNGCTQCLPGR